MKNFKKKFDKISFQIELELKNNQNVNAKYQEKLAITISLQINEIENIGFKTESVIMNQSNSKN